MSVYKLSCLFILVFCYSVIYGQNELLGESNSSLKRNAKIAIRNNDPYMAVNYLEEYNKRKPKDLHYRYLLAQQYQKSRNYEMAYKMYKSVDELGRDKYKKALFYQAEMEMRLGKYAEARQHYEEFRDSYRGEKDEIEWRRLAKDKMESSIFADTLYKSEHKYSVQHLSTSINKAYVEQSPIYVNPTTVLFIALRSDTLIRYQRNEDVQLPKRKFYLAKKENKEWKFAGEVKFDAFFNDYELSSASISPDGQRMIISACKANENGKIQCQLFELSKKGNDWANPKALPKAVNEVGTSNTQPTIANGKKDYREIIYFVSDRKDGKGGNDIWYTIYDKRKESYREARNAGMKINSRQDEITPFYDNETAILYFSSEGHKGLGGLDVFFTEGYKSKWEEPINVGIPLNSPADELYFTPFPNGIDGMFVSNRAGGVALKNKTCCDDLYAFRKIDSVQIIIKCIVFKDSVLSEGTKMNVYFINSEGEKIYNKSSFTDKNGNVIFNLLPGRKYQIESADESTFTEIAVINTLDAFDGMKLEKYFYLKTMKDRTFVLENINYEFDKDRLTDEAKTIIDEKLLPILINNPQIIAELGSHTDNKGTEAYNKALSQNRAESVVKYLIFKGIEASRLKSKGYGESQPIAKNTNADGSDNPEGRAMNRRTEIRVIGIVEVFDDEEDF